MRRVLNPLEDVHDPDIMSFIINPYRFAPPAGLSIDPIHWWDLDDDGVWSDDGTTGGWAWTENGTITTTAGGPNSQTVAVLNATGEYFDLTAKTWGEAQFSVSLWYYITSLNSTGNWLLNHRDNTSSTKAYQLRVRNLATDNVGGNVWDDAGTSAAPTWDGGSNTSQWYHLVLTADLTADEYKIYVDNDLKTTDTTTLGTAPSATMAIALGTSAWSKGTAANQMLGRLGMVGLWDGILDADDVSYLNNSGNGRKFADL
jgi:hypothetical protein